MRLFLLSPALSDASPNQMRAYLDEIAAALAAALQPTGQEFLVGAWHDGEIGMQDESFDERRAGKRLRVIANPSLLQETLRRCADPDDGHFMLVRCQTTCRAVSFGYDGQAFLCLRHEDAPPQSSALMRVEDCSQLLIETDYLDG